MSLSRGQRLRRLREQRGADQKDVAAAIGISRPYVSRLESDSKGHVVDHVRATLERAARYFGVIPEYLLVETPQEYIAAWVGCGAATDVPSTFGGRLWLVLAELRTRWGDDYHVDWLASGLGTTPEMLQGYLAGEIPPTASMIERISALTGAPVAWLLSEPVQSDQPPSSAFKRIFTKAIANGMEPEDLELLVDAWVNGRTAKRPSG